MMVGPWDEGDWNAGWVGSLDDWSGDWSRCVEILACGLDMENSGQVKSGNAAELEWCFELTS